MSEGPEVIAAIRQDIAATTREDGIGIWSVVQMLEESLEGCGTKQVVDIALGLVFDFVDSGLVLVKEANEAGVVSSPAEAVDFVREEIARLGRTPILYEVGWLVPRSAIDRVIDVSCLPPSE